MVLTPQVAYVTAQPNPWAGVTLESLLLAQHERDMSEEIACPAHPPRGPMQTVERRGDDAANVKLIAPCALCGDTGRVTLGRIVAADRTQRGGRPRADRAADGTRALMGPASGRDAPTTSNYGNGGI